MTSHWKAFVWWLPLFLFIIVFSTCYNLNSNLNCLKRRWCAWDSNPGWQDGRSRQIHWTTAAPQLLAGVWWDVLCRRVVASHPLQNFMLTNTFWTPERDAAVGHLADLYEVHLGIQHIVSVTKNYLSQIWSHCSWSCTVAPDLVKFLHFGKVLYSLAISGVFV